jgi:hypothetical protein
MGMYNTRIISYKYIDEDVEEVGAGWFVIPSQNVHEDTEESHEGPQLRHYFRCRTADIRCRTTG